MGLTIKLYAEHRGVTPKAVREALKRERISLDVDGTIDPIVADEEWAANTSQVHARPNGRRGNPKTGSMVQSSKRRSDAYTAYLELKTAKLADELIDRAVAERAIANLATQFKDQFLAFCQREAPMVYAEGQSGGAGAVGRYLNKAARQELARMADAALDLKGA